MDEWAHKISLGLNFVNKLCFWESVLNLTVWHLKEEDAETFPVFL